MCGRMNVIDDPNVRAFMDALGIPLYPHSHSSSNQELRPTDETLLLIPKRKANVIDVAATSMRWGIQPSWSKKLLINAKSETIQEKNTFKKAFEQRRGLVVCSGWYEWKDEGGAKKQKYLVQHSLKQPMLMAAVCFSGVSSNQDSSQESHQFVTLTTEPNEKLKYVHHRMPLIIHNDEMDNWLLGDSQQALNAIHPMPSELFQFEAC